MQKLAATETLRKISLGEINLDEIVEVIRSAEHIITSNKQELERLRRNEEGLKTDLEMERKAVDDLTYRLAELHKDNQMAKDIFRTEIEGKQQILGIPQTLDLAILDMQALITRREEVQKQLNRQLDGNERAPSNRRRVPLVQ